MEKRDLIPFAVIGSLGLSFAAVFGSLIYNIRNDPMNAPEEEEGARGKKTKI